MEGQDPDEPNNNTKGDDILTYSRRKRRGEVAEGQIRNWSQ